MSSSFRGADMAKVLLHGMLHVTIYEVAQFSDEYRRSLVIDEAGKFIDEIFDWLTGKKEIYATIDLEQATVGKTKVLIHVKSKPKWYETFHIYCAHLASNITFSVKDIRPIGPDEVIGRAHLPVQHLQSGEELDTWLDLLDKDDNESIKGLKIHVKVQFLDVTQEGKNWDKGIKTPDFPGVPFTFFPQRNGCRVTLYQDAHVDEGFSPRIPLSEGKYYEPNRCWEDVFDAICGAKYMIYITGWSVYTRITLVRDPKRVRPGGGMTLGELLKKRAREGVRVLMLVWDDRTGFAKTHDEETKSYFHGSKVHCVLCPRDPDINGRNVLNDVDIALLFTHHQKSLVVDSSDVLNQGSNKRSIVSFVGGIDLCDGRYDTQSHSLFRTLNTVHHNDFYQSNFDGPSISKGGPREPWHDIHSRLEGLVAWDVLFNFEQRWRKQGGNHDLLLNITQMNDIFISPSPSNTLLDLDHETWNVQVLRSIDGGAAFGFPESLEDGAKLGLVRGENIIIERSIQDAYINAIRRATKFIYIENQYFLGSSFGWKESNDIGALHLIPKELSLKIVSKIEKGERFSVYVVVPMWPEGLPDSGPVQAILNWQRRTMEMMYADIAKALSAKGIEANPKDYLSFFCLGNREVKRGGEYQPPEEPEPDSDYSRAQQARRFMIYVHAKMMIVDDEYIIVGSANINQRSMDGGRDTEIAMGAYQPHHLCTQSQQAKGQVHGFRMSLWYEHLGMFDDVFLQPESIECVRKVNEIAQKYWELYTSDTLEHDLPGHLLSYPVVVTQNGEIEQLPGFKHFPDTKGSILGEKSGLLPAILTS